MYLSIYSLQADRGLLYTWLDRGEQEICFFFLCRTSIIENINACIRPFFIVDFIGVSAY